MHPYPKSFRGLLLAFALLLLLPAVIACGNGGDDDPADPTQLGGTAVADATGTTATDPGVTATGDATEDAEASPSPASTRPSNPAATTPNPSIPVFPTNTPGPVATSSVDHRENEFAYGWNVAVRGDDTGAEHNQQVIQAVQDSGFGWVRFQMEWSQFERADDQWDPLPADRVIDAFNAAGINILIVVAKAPDWARGNGQLLADYGEFHEFMAFVSDRYKGKVQAWEIWNEQNLAHEMGGNVNVTDYFNLLQAGSRGVRTGDPDALIVFGGLTPNGVNDPAIAIDDLHYLELLYQYRGGEISEYFDILGMHLNSTHNPPDTMWPDNPSDEEGWNDDDSFYFRRAEQLRQVMLRNGDDDKPVWITEFGWTTANQAPGYEYGVNNTEEEVAEYLVRALEIARDEWDFVTGAFVWNLNWSTLAPPEDEKSPWSALNADWSPRPAYIALSEFEKR